MKQYEKELFGKPLAGGLILLLGLGVLLGVYKFLLGFVGALILFTLLNPFYNYMRQKTSFSKGFVAVFLSLISVIIILIPLFFIGSIAIDEVLKFGRNTDGIREFMVTSVAELDERFPNIDLQKEVHNMFDTAIRFLQSLLTPLLQQATSLILNVIIAYLLLYFMLTEKNIWKKKLFEFIPFSRQNSQKLVSEFTKVTNSMILSTGVVAVVQGIILGISLWVVGIPSPILWGTVGAIFAFLPFIGTPIVWIPVAGFLLLSGQLVTATIFIIFSAIVTTNVDNVLRPILNKNIAKIHPLTTFLGVFIGLSLFGIMGLILGPLLISYFFLTIEMYREEYGEHVDSDYVVEEYTD